MPEWFIHGIGAEELEVRRAVLGVSMRSSCGAMVMLDMVGWEGAGKARRKTM